MTDQPPIGPSLGWQLEVERLRELLEYKEADLAAARKEVEELRGTQKKFKGTVCKRTGAHAKEGGVCSEHGGDACLIYVPEWVKQKEADLAAAKAEIKMCKDAYDLLYGHSTEESLRADLAAAREALKAVEWAAVHVRSDGDIVNICPLCSRRKTQGHEADCLLAPTTDKTEE